MKIIDGKGLIMGRLAAYVAKEALKGEEIVILNCGEVVITGTKANIKEEFEAMRHKKGRAFHGPKIKRSADRIVKRTIRGMLPDHREGRGREAFKKIKCYVGVPKEFENEKRTEIAKRKIDKFIEVKELSKELKK